jgi:hypothetical protein
MANFMMSSLSLDWEQIFSLSELPLTLVLTLTSSRTLLHL